MPGRPLSEIQQMNMEHNQQLPDNNEENTNDADSLVDDTEPILGL